jgi:hypothetical protein
MASAGALAWYHPFCSSNPVATWPGVGAQDSIHYLSGVVLHRRFTAWREGQGYDLEIGSAGGAVSRVRWELVPMGTERSQLTISIWPSALLGYPPAVRWVLHRCWLLPMLRRYLRAVLRGLEHYLTTGRVVAPNQFGRVWFFSRPVTRKDETATLGGALS